MTTIMEQRWSLTVGKREPSTFWSPSRHAARNMAATEAAGRPFILEPVCPYCDEVIQAGEALGDDGRYCHPRCMHLAAGQSPRGC